MQKFHHKLYIIYPFFMLILSALILNSIATKTDLVAGLEPVGCIDPTKPLVENFQTSISITISGKKVLLNPNIGHDPGQCLREIHTNDQSGIVYVQKNSHIQYTLSDFFQVWRKPFDKTKILSQPIDSYHQATILINGNEVQSPTEALLSQNDQIEINFH